MTAEQRKALGQRLRAARLAAGLTQEKVAEQAGISPTYMPRLEAGAAAPSLDVLLQLAAALGVPAGVLLGGAEEGAPPDPLREEVAALVRACSGRQLRLLRDVVAAVRRHVE